jgi:methionine synthase II (cobalamin-independent)
MTEKFRADQIGSLLRPEALLAARRGHDAGAVTDGGLRPAEDQAITSAVRQQEATGIDVLTDGEFRRRDFRSGFAQAVDGIETSAWDMPWHSAEGTTRLRSIAFTATARLSQRERLAGGEVAFVRSLTSAPVKATLIAPGFLADRFRKDGLTRPSSAGRTYPWYSRTPTSTWPRPRSSASSGRAARAPRSSPAAAAPPPPRWPTAAT